MSGQGAVDHGSSERKDRSVRALDALASVHSACRSRAPAARRTTPSGRSHVMRLHAILARTPKLSPIVSLFGRMTDDFDVVSVGIEHERTVVVLVIVRSRTRRSVVFSTGRERRFVELVHLSTVVGAERDVNLGS